MDGGNGAVKNVVVEEEWMSLVPVGVRENLMSLQDKFEKACVGFREKIEDLPDTQKTKAIKRLDVAILNLKHHKKIFVSTWKEYEEEVRDDPNGPLCTQLKKRADDMSTRFKLTLTRALSAARNEDDISDIFDPTSVRVF